MNQNCKGMKSLMDFYPKSESNAETGRNVPTDLEKLRYLATLCSVQLTEVEDTFPNAYKMAATAFMICVSVSTCEASFGAYSRILTPFQRSMSNSRMRNLVLCDKNDPKTVLESHVKRILPFHKHPQMKQHKWYS
ncbi:hypothetical protein T11_13816 [Trichinella zimbabwensis]|uniref:HAT C-terminal dimerisation domain-containing protein n=1 Tax=Trichinella zimbabwensis TaxID=268475 RepID=A0A0V1HAZ9_9BILA|nr:hypothetical protein T11_13816 [Trichinella zimbabwensis]